MRNDDFQERNSMLAAIIDSSEDAIISKNLNGIIMSWNKAAERMFGYKEAEVKGKHVSILIPQDRLPEEDMIISSLKAGNRIEHYETIRVTKDGRFLNISLTVSPVKNEEGVIIGASKIARDITRQKEAEETIRRYNEQLKLINAIGKTISAHLEIKAILQKVTDTTTQLSSAAFGVFLFEKVSPTGESSLIYTISGLTRQTFDALPSPRNKELLEISFKDQKTVRVADVSKDPAFDKEGLFYGLTEGTNRVTSYMAVPVVSSSGSIIGGLFFGHPKPGIFTEEHESLVVAIASQAAIALDNAKLYEEVRQLNDKKDEFISFASHELKTPLTSMNGYLQLVEQKPELVADLIPKMHKQVKRLFAIISDLLDISKINAGKLDLNFTPVNLQALIKETIESTAQIGISHTIVTDIPSDDIQLIIDGPKVLQVLTNLLTNAIKYSNRGTKITISGMRFGDQVRISFQDEGMGIAPQNLHRIFNRFYRVSKSSSQVEGMGLGLFISQEIIAGHNGRIWAESEEGKGSVFHVDIPIDAR